ncbi:MAG: hypothetical protein EOO73_09020 [Myxococcales bacterium]|nr:MAG: hypothetical protein EOO73_09020 [Myxococcales bacterium]
MAEPLISKSVLEAIAEDTRVLLNRPAREVVDAALAAACAHAELACLSSSPVPFFFELRGEPASDRLMREWYDATGRVLASEKPSVKGRSEYWIYVRGAVSVDCFLISAFKGTCRLSRVARRGTVEPNLGYFVATSGGAQAHAYVWAHELGRVSRLEIWDLRANAPDRVEATYDGKGELLRLTRNGTLAWSASPAPSTPLSSGELADRLLRAARSSLAKATEPALALTVCFVRGDAASLPPCLGVVFERDAEAFVLQPSRFESEHNALWNPTLQQDSGFPANAQYPFAALGADEVRLEGSAAEVEQHLRALMDQLNARRAPSEPPFLLLDLAGDCTDYVGRLSASDRLRLARFLPAAPEG